MEPDLHPSDARCREEITNEHCLLIYLPEQMVEEKLKCKLAVDTNFDRSSEVCWGIGLAEHKRGRGLVKRSRQ